MYLREPITNKNSPILGCLWAGKDDNDMKRFLLLSFIFSLFLSLAYAGDSRRIKVGGTTTLSPNITGRLSGVVTWYWDDGILERVAPHPSPYSSLTFRALEPCTRGTTVTALWDTFDYSGQVYPTSHKDTWTIYIDKVEPSNVSLGKESKKTIDLPVGNSYDLNAILSPTYATTTLSWESSNSAVTISKTGTYTASVYGKNSGSTARIKVTTNNGLSDYCDVKVMPKDLVNLYLSNMTILQGDYATIETTRYPSYADDELIWECSNTNVTVNQSGRIYGNLVGSAVVTATSQKNSNIKGSCTVTVIDPPISVSLNVTKLELHKGTSQLLEASVLPSNAPQEIIWESANASIATVNSLGLVEGIKEGTTIIKAYSVRRPVYKECTVTVLPPSPQGIVLNTTSVALSKGDTKQLSASIYPSDAPQGVTWSTDDSSVATVSSTGVVTAKGVGNVAIKAMSLANSSINSTCMVAVILHSGSLENPFDVTDACNYANSLENGSTSQERYYIKGKISKIVNAFNSSSGNATFYISDNGTTNQLYVCMTYFLQGKSWKDNDAIAIGDEVIIYGKLANEKGTLKTANNESFIYSLNGLTDVTFANNDIFRSETEEGVSMLFKVISSRDRTCQVGNGNSPSVSFLDTKGDITIPKEVNGFVVTKIGNNAFEDCSKLTNIFIPNTISSIGEDAFRGCNFKSISIPHSVTSIGDYAFSFCNELTNITMSNNVTSIARYLFLYCDGLSDFSIPNSAISIGEGAFRGCTGLTSITIPNSVKFIDSNAFQDCTALVNIKIPKSVTDIGSSIFSGCTSLSSLIVDDENTVFDSRDNCNAIIKTASNMLVTGCPNTVIPNSVTSIDSWAFSDCTGLTSITIPKSVTFIDNWAFRGCTGLTNLTIPRTLKSIRSQSFSGCTELCSIVVEEGNVTYDSRNECNAIIETSTNTLVMGCKNTIIPNTIKSIGSYAFQGCIGLVSVTIPYSITSIGIDAFEGCKSLTSIRSEIKKLFSISESVFQYSYNRPLDATLYVPIGTLSDYKSTSGWNQLNIVEEEMELPELIDGDVFTANTEEGVEMTFTVISYGNKTCQVGRTETNGISTSPSISRDTEGTITIPEMVKGLTVIRIGDYAFNDCYKLIGINIPNSVNSIGYGAFRGCSHLESIAIPSTVTSPFNGTFQDCTNLKSIIMSPYITSIGQYAFCNCRSLKSITIPKTVASIGYQSFYGCTGLTSIMSEITEPLPIISSSRDFQGVNATLYVPFSSKTKYEATSGWSYFNIVEMEPKEGDQFKGQTEEGGCLTYQIISVSDNTCQMLKYNSTSQIDAGAINNDSFVPYYSSNKNSTTQLLYTPDEVGSIGVIKSISFNVANASRVTTDEVNVYLGHKKGTFTNTYDFLTSDDLTLVYSGMPSLGQTEGWEKLEFNKGDFCYNGTDNLVVVITRIGTASSNLKYYYFLDKEGYTLYRGNWSDTSYGDVANVNNRYKKLSDRPAVRFEFCHNKITIPETAKDFAVTHIGENAFRECNYLQNVIVPNSVSSIGANAFYGCTELTAVEIPEGVTMINNAAFAGCTSLETVTLPSTLFNIGMNSFSESKGNIKTIINHVKKPFLIDKWTFGIKDTCYDEYLRDCR